RSDRACAALPDQRLAACRPAGRRSLAPAPPPRTFGDRVIVTGDDRSRLAPRQRVGEAAPEVFAVAVNLKCEHRVTRAAVRKATGSRVAGRVFIVLGEGFCAADSWHQLDRTERPTAERRCRPGVGVDSLTSRHGVPTVIAKLP